MSEEYSETSLVNNNISKTLYAEDRVARIAKELGYTGTGGMSEMVNEIRNELLQENSIIIVNTSASDDGFEIFKPDDALLDDNNTFTSVISSEDTVITNEADVIQFLKTKAEKLEETLYKQGYNLSDKQVGTLKKVLKTAPTELSNRTNKLFNLATGTTKVATKGATIATKAGGALVRFGQNFNVLDAEGKVNAVEAGGNQIKTAAKFVGRNTVAKPVAKGVKKLNNKIASKAVTKAVTKVQKLEAKVAAKVTSKVAKVAIKVLSKIIQALVQAVVACWPLAVVLLVFIVVIIVVTQIFGAGLKDNDIKNYTDYITATQTQMQATIDNYTKDNYKVDGTYSGTAYIDWKAVLSVLQGLKSGEVSGGSEEIELLKQWQKDEVMYKITSVTTNEYVRVPEIKDENGKVIQKEEKTNKKYVVVVGTLEDYKEWVRNNPDYIKSFYHQANIAYDDDCEDFMTEEVEEITNRLYESDEFSSLFSGITFDKTTFAPGTIFDTGEHNGSLAYPTAYRTISADFPTYPSGKSHTGIDFPVPVGTPICAAYDGTVYIAKNLETSYGHYIVLKHNIEGQTIYTLYAHNSTLLVSQGQTVKQGQVIAYSGSTGNSTGPHCHFSVLTSYSPQKYVDPKKWL